jgi:hypothetical protein
MKSENSQQRTKEDEHEFEQATESFFGDHECLGGYIPFAISIWL